MATIREETLIRFAAEHGADAALALAADSPPCQTHSAAGTRREFAVYDMFGDGSMIPADARPLPPTVTDAVRRGLARFDAGTGRETHTVTYDGQTIRVVHHNGTVSTVLRTSDVGRGLTDALFEVLRLRAEAPATAQAPAHGDPATPGGIVHRYTDCPDLTGVDGYHLTDDDPRPVTCPTCRKTLGLPGRDNPPLHAPCFEARHGFEPDMDPDVVTWQPGTCAACGAAGVIVFRLSDDAAAALGGD